MELFIQDSFVPCYLRNMLYLEGSIKFELGLKNLGQNTHVLKLVVLYIYEKMKKNTEKSENHKNIKRGKTCLFGVILPVLNTRNLDFRVVHVCMYQAHSRASTVFQY